MSRGDRARRCPRPRAARGFTYLGLLALIVLMGLLLSAAGEVAAASSQRDREAQLLWTGHQYRDAIGRYFRHKRAYPQTLSELLGAAPDAPLQVRYLRNLYPDPMTGSVEWTLIPAPNGGVMGVASRSKRAPLKTGHFGEGDSAFNTATSYSDWQFTYVPAAARRGAP